VGHNTLTLTGTLYLPDDPDTNCQNWDDPARWLSIAPTALLHLSYTPGNPQLDLANFPQNFIDPLAQYLPEDSRKPTLIVLPEAATPDDLSALSSISYVLGSQAEAGLVWQPDIITENQFNQRWPHQPHFIGSTSRSPGSSRRRRIIYRFLS
jgi:hypothetical protein